MPRIEAADELCGFHGTRPSGWVTGWPVEH